MGKRRWNGSNLLGHPSPQRRRRRHQTACDEFDSNILHNVKQQSSLHAFFGVKTRPSPMEVRSRSRCTPTIVGTPPTPQAELQRCRPTPPTSTAHPPPSTPVIKTQRVRKKTQQLYLDCGQRDFGSRSVCATCGMLYVHGLVEDAIQHARICQDYIQGVPFAIPTSTLSSFWSTQALSIHAIQSTSKRMVRLGTVPERLIVEVRPTDTANLRKKVLQVQRIVDQELGFVASSDAKPARRITYLCIQNKRVVGMACVELIDQAYALIQTAQAYERSSVPVKAMLGIHQLWVHSKFRSRGIATNLIDAARAKMVFGLVVPVDQVAFSSPTQAGAEFARRYYQHRATTAYGTGATDCNSKPHPTSNRVLVYDCGS